MRTHPKTAIVFVAMFFPILLGLVTKWLGLDLAPGIGVAGLIEVVSVWKYPDEIVRCLDARMRKQVSTEELN